MGFPRLYLMKFGLSNLVIICLISLFHYCIDHLLILLYLYFFSSFFLISTYIIESGKHLNVSISFWWCCTVKIRSVFRSVGWSCWREGTPTSGQSSSTMLHCCVWQPGRAFPTWWHSFWSLGQTWMLPLTPACPRFAMQLRQVTGRSCACCVCGTPGWGFIGDDFSGLLEYFFPFFLCSTFFFFFCPVFLLLLFSVCVFRNMSLSCSMDMIQGALGSCHPFLGDKIISDMAKVPLVWCVSMGIFLHFKKVVIFCQFVDIACCNFLSFLLILYWNQYRFELHIVESFMSSNCC